ncbi:MAG: hypothetical protein HYX72_07040 [Acidobacteria bacterium]|nr:hypothetical protein [Acidobacteriota bacterium]
MTLSLRCGPLLLAASLVLVNGLFGSLAAQNTPAARAVTKRSVTANKAITAAEFSRIVRYFSEEEGSFFSDNFVSNETAYLHIVDKLKELGVAGGAYIGVGPEQNFTYIAKVRPKIAFIVDIRRGAMIQHLMYKALFHMASDRVHFLSLLFSKPLQGEAPGRDASATELVDYFNNVATEDKAYEETLAALRNMLEQDFEFPLSARDGQILEHVYSAFQRGNLDISFRFAGAMGAWYGGFPTLRDLMLEKDLRGKQGNFLASENDFGFIRDLHRKNRIIPVVGDFAGSKAFAVLGDYLKENGYTVSAFYVSNVEQFLFGDRVFGAFAENVRRLPINERSVIIRSLRVGAGHPAHVPGHRMATVLQKMQVFLDDFDAGRFPDYWSLAVTDFITGNEP